MLAKSIQSGLLPFLVFIVAVLTVEATFAQQAQEPFVGHTRLYKNNIDAIPQVEYFAPDGRAAVWTAALGNRVVPAGWIVREDSSTGERVLCLVYPKEALNLEENLQLCDTIKNIERFVQDRRPGDRYNLMSLEPQAKALPMDIQNLSQLDALLGQ